MSNEPQNLLSYIRHFIGFSLYKHREEGQTNDEIECVIDERIESMSKIELIHWIDAWMEEKQ